MPLVAGIDSSTQSCKVSIRDLDSGELVRAGRASHPVGTVVDPQAWISAAHHAIGEAGGLGDVVAISVAGQQHGMVCIDKTGNVVRPAMLWNDTQSGQATRDLIDEWGAPFWSQTIGGLPVPSFTATKLRWLRDHEPEHARSTHAVALPHDYVAWRLMGYGPQHPDFNALATDRSEASGTGYWSPFEESYRYDILESALGRLAHLPRIHGPGVAAGSGISNNLLFGAGAGDNASSALRLGARSGDVVVSLGTSGAAFSVTQTPTLDPEGMVASFADATGRYLPLIGTINMAKAINAVMRILDVDYSAMSELASAAPAGAQGLTILPYLEGERTPNLPSATGSMHGLTLANSTRSNLARATLEGVMCSLADGLDALRRLDVSVERVILIGGVAQSHAMQHIAPDVFGVPVTVPPVGEYVADGAAFQAAWTYTQTVPKWELGQGATFEPPSGSPVREQYRRAQQRLGYHDAEAG